MDLNSFFGNFNLSNNANLDNLWGIGNPNSNSVWDGRFMGYDVIRGIGQTKPDYFLQISKLNEVYPNRSEYLMFAPNASNGKHISALHHQDNDRNEGKGSVHNYIKIYDADGNEVSPVKVETQGPYDADNPQTFAGRKGNLQDKLYIYMDDSDVPTFIVENYPDVDNWQDIAYGANLSDINNQDGDNQNADNSTSTISADKVNINYDNLTIIDEDQELNTIIDVAALGSEINNVNIELADIFTFEPQFSSDGKDLTITIEGVKGEILLKNAFDAEGNVIKPITFIPAGDDAKGHPKFNVVGFLDGEVKLTSTSWIAAPSIQNPAADVVDNKPFDNQQDDANQTTNIDAAETNKPNNEQIDKPDNAADAIDFADLHSIIRGFIDAMAANINTHSIFDKWRTELKKIIGELEANNNADNSTDNSDDSSTAQPDPENPIGNGDESNITPLPVVNLPGDNTGTDSSSASGNQTNPDYDIPVKPAPAEKSVLPVVKVTEIKDEDGNLYTNIIPEGKKITVSGTVESAETVKKLTVTTAQTLINEEKAIEVDVDADGKWSFTLADDQALFMNNLSSVAISATTEESKISSGTVLKGVNNDIVNEQLTNSTEAYNTYASEPRFFTELFTDKNFDAKDVPLFISQGYKEFDGAYFDYAAYSVNNSFVAPGHIVVPRVILTDDAQNANVYYNVIQGLSEEVYTGKIKELAPIDEQIPEYRWEKYGQEINTSSSKSILELAGSNDASLELEDGSVVKTNTANKDLVNFLKNNCEVSSEVINDDVSWTVYTDKETGNVVYKEAFSDAYFEHSYPSSYIHYSNSLSDTKLLEYSAAVLNPNYIPTVELNSNKFVTTRGDEVTTEIRQYLNLEKPTWWGSEFNWQDEYYTYNKGDAIPKLLLENMELDLSSSYVHANYNVSETTKNGELIEKVTSQSSTTLEDGKKVYWDHKVVEEVQSSEVVAGNTEIIKHVTTTESKYYFNDDSYERVSLVDTKAYEVVKEVLNSAGEIISSDVISNFEEPHYELQPYSDEQYALLAESDALVQVAGSKDENNAIFTTKFVDLKSEEVYYPSWQSAVIGNSKDNVLSVDIPQEYIEYYMGGIIGPIELDGKEGSDTLVGNIGVDIFTFSTALDGSIDTIQNFDLGLDYIGLSKTVFANLAAAQTQVDADSSMPEFYTELSTGFGSYILHNQETGAISYDYTGQGNEETAVQFAQVDYGLDLTASNFVLVDNDYLAVPTMM